MTNRYNERKVKTCQCCYNCKHGKPYESSEEECTLQYCMLDVPEEDLKHVEEILSEDEDYDDRFCDIFGVNDNEWLDNSFRLVEPDEVCQFYEKE